MDLKKLEKMAKVVLDDLSAHDSSQPVRGYDELEAEFKNLLNVAFKSLPEHKDLFTVTYKNINIDYYPLKIHEARHVINHLLRIIEIEKTSEEKTREGKIFESAEEKMKQVGISFQRDDYSSIVHNLNTALELVLKDKLGIPTTITSINTSNIIDILVKHKVGPYLYLSEVKKRVLEIDNKTKHQGYSPSKVDCINGMKAMEELISKLRNISIELSEEVRNKIYEGL